MAITVQPATPSDALNLTHCNNSAFQSDPLNNAAFNLPTHPAPEQWTTLADFRKGRFEKILSKTNVHVIKATDDSSGGAIVGYFSLYAPRDLDSETDQLENPREIGELPESFNRELMERVGKMLAEVKTRAIGERKDVWYLGSFAVIPSYQGRGIGQQLMQYCLDLADGQAGDIYLESSPVAKNLYARNGFEVLEDIPVLERISAVAMLRKSPARK